MTGQSQDVFPKTQVTWLRERIAGGDDGITQANRHVMSAYAHPLRVYILGSSFRRVAEPEELINGFFADRLARDGYLARWLESGRPLRLWLLTGFRHFMMEEIRRRGRASHAELSPEAHSHDEHDAQAAYDAACKQVIVKEALNTAAERCRSKGLDRHWAVFLSHHVGGEAYDVIAARENVSAARAAVMARTATRTFREVLRELTAWPGATSEEIDHEIAGLLE